MKFNIVALRAVVGEKSFINLINDEDSLDRICNATKYKEWLDIDTKIANSYEIQKKYKYDELVDTHDPRLSISAQKFKDVAKDELIDNGDGTFDYGGDLDVLRVNMKFRKLSNLDIRLSGAYELPESISGSEVTGNCDLSRNYLRSLQNSPHIVGGDYDVSQNELQSLHGAPEEIGDGFDCSNNKLSSLEGAPKIVGSHFICYDCDLKSLKGAPETVRGGFNCESNVNLRSLEGAPKIVTEHFVCANCSLESLEGAPEEVGRDFICYDCSLESLEGAPKIVGGNFDVSFNKLTSLKGAPKIVGGDFKIYNNSIEFTEEQVRAVCDVRGNVILEGRFINEI